MVNISIACVTQKKENTKLPKWQTEKSTSKLLLSAIKCTIYNHIYVHLSLSR